MRATERYWQRVWRDVKDRIRIYRTMVVVVDIMIPDASSAYTFVSLTHNAARSFHTALPALSWVS